MTEPTNTNPRNYTPGCYVDGTYGHYATARMVLNFYSYASHPSLAERYANDYTIGTPEDQARLMHVVLAWADDIEQALSDYLAPFDLSCGWYDGEFFIYNTDDPNFQE